MATTASRANVPRRSWVWIGAVFFSLVLSLSSGVATASAASPVDANRESGECQPTAEVSPGFPQLPDCRRYELVTPAQKNGALIGAAVNVLAAQVATEGSRVIAVSLQCLPEAESCEPNREPNEGNPYEFLRSGDGWLTRALAPPASEVVADSYYSLNANLDTALFSAPGPPEGQDDFYARIPDGQLVNIGPLGESKTASNTALCVQCAKATGDLSHVVYGANTPLWAFDHGAPKASSLYEYVGTDNHSPILVGVEGGHGSENLVSHCGTRLAGESSPYSGDGTESENGRLVYFIASGEGCGAPAPEAAQLWARIDGELPDAHSVLISGATEAACTTSECHKNTSEPADLRAPAFRAASNDGSRVVFTDAQQLTDSASEGVEGEANLYESECAEYCEDPQSERRLIDISDPGIGARPISGGPRVQGVMAVSTDGSHVYFVARGVLTEEENPFGVKAEDEAENLYVYTEGHLTFIARLSESDEQAKQWRGGVIANVTPDGQFVVFTADRALTTDDTREEGEDAEHAAQVYEYNAQTRELRRISVGASGKYECHVTKRIEAGYNCDGNSETGNANIAEANRGGSQTKTTPIRLDPTMSQNGELVFFESPIALTPGALNDVPAGHEETGTGRVRGPLYAENIYEYYRGQVYLLSDGKDVTERSGALVSEYPENHSTGLIGVDTSGANVFFSTFDQLAPEDKDTERDYYDARSCSEEREADEPCSAPPVEATESCGEGSNCQAAPLVAPLLSTPASEALSGGGNLASPATVIVKLPVETRVQKLAKSLKACRTKQNKHKRAVCEATARKRYGPVAKKHNTSKSKSKSAAKEAK